MPVFRRILGDTTQFPVSGTGGGGGGSISLTNVGTDRIVTVATANQINGEANFTFNGSQLQLSGNSSFSGNLDVQSGTILLRSVESGSLAGAGSYLALNSSNEIILTSSAGSGGGSISISSGSTTVSTVSSINTDFLGIVQDLGGGSIAITGTIGYPEDGVYTDGLYTDFTPATPIGTAIDKFNEIFAILAPTPAPALSRVNFISDTGVSAKLSFGTSQTVTQYTSSGDTAGFSAVDINGTYENASSGNNFRIGVLDGSQHVTGTLNFTVGPSQTNGNLAFNSGAFGNAESGDLKLELNGTVIHTTNMANVTGTGQPATGTFVDVTNNSGFIDYSLSASSFDGNGSEWYIFQHRTAKFKVDANDQEIGWNYARVIHTFAGTDYATNYVEWINDPSGSTNDLRISIPRIEDITRIGSKFLSGIEYNTDVTGNYKANIHNLYRNVYAATGTPISFTVTNSTTPSAQSVPVIDTSAGETNEKILGVTASVNYNGNSLVNGAITCNSTVTHPMKNTISNTGSATTGNGFLIDDRTLASTNLIENFHDETYRKVSGNFDAQTDATNASSIWNSQNHMTSSGATGHTDGLLYFNQRLYSPKDSDVPNSGDIASLSNVEPGQPDYSGISGTRTFFRILSNSSGADKFDLKITSTKVGTTYNNSTLGASNAQFFVKIPGSSGTGFMDISQNFTYGSVNTGDGALISGASNDTDSGNNVHHVTFGTASIPNNGYAMIKIIADASWEGYISQLQFALGATTNTATAAPALDDIDADNTGTAAKLSFGGANIVTDYQKANGGSIGLTDFDSNDDYTVSGDRRGIFSSFPTLAGTLNEDVSSNGNNYPQDAFKDGYTGSLVLEVNGLEVHDIELNSSLNSILNDNNGNGSGFSVSEVGFSTTTDNIPDYNKPYRTGSYRVASGDQRNGWNYARIIHRIGVSDTTTNYVEWIVDPSGSTDDTAVTPPNLANFDHHDVYYQSGIGYFASRPSASLDFTASNFYRNVYSNSSTAISFPTTTNCSVSNIRISGSGITTFNSAVSQTGMPALNNSTNCQEKHIEITGTILFDDLTSISGGLGLHTSRDVSANSTVVHPFKTNRTTSTVSKTDFMVYSGTIGSTTEEDQEYFNTEAYRIVSGNYTTQASLTNSGNKWNSTTAMNNGGTHDDGAVTVNGYMISPKQIGDDGDTRSAAEGGALQAPDGNPNYSSLTTATRTFYRYFFNNTVNDRSSITITLYGSGSLVKKATSLGGNGNFYVEAKISGKTAWLDVGTAYSSNNPLVDGAGALDGAAPGNPAIEISPGGTSVVCNFNGESLLGGANDEKFALKVSVDEDWIGYLSRIGISYS